MKERKDKDYLPKFRFIKKETIVADERMGGASLAELQERMPPRSCRSEGCPSSAKRMDAIIPSPSLCVLSSRALLVYACAYLTFVRVQVA